MMYICEDSDCTTILRQVAPENTFDKIDVGANQLKHDIGSLYIKTAPAANPRPSEVISVIGKHIHHQADEKLNLLCSIEQLEARNEFSFQYLQSIPPKSHFVTVNGQGNILKSVNHLIEISKQFIDLSKLFQQGHNKFIDSVSQKPNGYTY